MTTGNIYSFPMKDIKGQEFNTESLKGKVVLIFNTASACGFTGQLKGMTELHEKYKDKGLVILGFPSNEFGGQEPGTGEEIQSFCSLNYGVQFGIMEKTLVNGDNANPLYSFLKKSKPGILGIEKVKWNFEKFLIDKEGVPQSRYSSFTTPAALEKEIEKLL